MLRYGAAAPRVTERGSGRAFSDCLLLTRWLYKIYWHFTFIPPLCIYLFVSLSYRGAFVNFIRENVKYRIWFLHPFHHCEIAICSSLTEFVLFKLLNISVLVAQMFNRRTCERGARILGTQSKCYQGQNGLGEFLQIDVSIRLNMIKY